MKLILVRHGETLSNRENRVQGVTDNELSDYGRLQAEKLAESLRSEPIDGIISSPLKRAYQTAQAICKFHEASIEVDSNLQEMNHGDFENISIAELREKHLPFLNQWFSDPASVAMPNGESLFDLQARAWGAIKKIMGNSKNVLVVSHGMTIMTILCRIKSLDLSHAKEMLVDVASKTSVEFEDGKGVIMIFNDTSHLKDI
ncbi:MAG TPA: histidine phosphatase family protein [Syntrophales bacterium]|nr:histidine phosphatase family protein [Syntrophales bacterium]